MAKNTEVYFYHKTRVEGYEFDNSDSTNLTIIATASTEGSRVLALSMTNKDGSDNAVAVYVYNPNTKLNRRLYVVPVPTLAGEGNGAVNAVAGMNATNSPMLPQDANGNYYIPLGANEILKASMNAAVSGANPIRVTAIIADFDV